jgi:glycosyltransferase involved in cell wall biosynthesis
MPKPKILRTITWLAPGGGVDEQVKLSLDGLSKEFDFHLLTGREIKSKDFFEIPNLTIHICKWMVPNFNPIMDIAAYFWIRRFLEKNKFDLIHTHESKSSFLTRLAKNKSSKVPLVYGIEGVVFNDPRHKFLNSFYVYLERMTVNRADRLVAVSLDVQSEYLKNGIGRDMSWEIVYSGIDVQKFVTDAPDSRKITMRNKLGISHDSFVFISIGRFSKSKNQQDSLLAFSRVKNELPQIDFRLILIGEGEELENCRILAAKLNVLNSIIFVGFTRDVHSYLSLADLHLITSLREGLPRVVVEASLMQVPTVGYEVEGITEIVDSNISGFVVAQGNIVEMARCCIMLIQEPAKRLEFGKSARQIAMTKWDYRIMNDKLLNLYQELMGDSENDAK